MFSGGFVGVDIFFVISGYLITGILIAELERGDFSISRFYERRARRILPALFIVMLACVPLAYMWMLPTQLKAFGQSLVAVVFFASNILFWREDGYFAPAAELKPLLHTWSLAVEEQYYLLFPVFLLAVWRFGRQRVFWSVVAIAVLSLLLAEWGWRNQASANFYLAPTRAWELLAGSICAFLTVGKARQASNVMSAVGLALIVFAIFAYSESTPFPSVYTLVPVVGTALIILFAVEGTWVARLLSLRVFVGVGLISYSAYLWHQPLFAFARLRSLTEPSLVLMAVLALAVLPLSWATWRYVEQPFRRRGNPILATRVGVFAASGAVGSVFVAFGLFAYLHQGNIFLKFDPRTVDLFAEMQRDNATWENMSALRMHEFPTNEKQNILVIGDSNSGDLLNSLIFAFDSAYNFSSVNISAGCGNLYLDRSVFEREPTVEPAIACTDSDKYDARVLQLIDRADYVFLASSWRKFEADFFKESWERLTERFGSRFYVFGAKNLDFSEGKLHEVNFEEVFDLAVSQRQEKVEVNESIERVVGGRFLDPSEIFCDGGSCKVFEGKNPLFYDGSHITLHGVAKLSAWLVNWMKEEET